MLKYSVIIPVFDRPLEIKELLESLSAQSFKNFEVIIVEDGSKETCEHMVKTFHDSLQIKYFFKNNTGPGDSRNFGMKNSTGDFFIFFDSDCLLPREYFSVLDKALAIRKLDAFGGPDSAQEAFSETQKAINYAMTSFFTTGGIRGGKKQLDKFQPRSFNMGISKKAYETVGGFSNIHPGEDPDLSYRIMDAGLNVGLISEAFVYHKRRVDFAKFTKQVYKFGVVRVILNKWHPKRKSLVYTLPSLFLISSIVLLTSALFTTSLWPLAPLGLLVLLLLADSFRSTGSLIISTKAVIASFIQLYSYGYGYLKSGILISVLSKNEKHAFSTFFFERK